MNRLETLYKRMDYIESRCIIREEKMKEAKARGDNMEEYKKSEGLYQMLSDSYFRAAEEAYSLCWGFAKIVYEAGAVI